MQQFQGQLATISPTLPTPPFPPKDQLHVAFVICLITEEDQYACNLMKAKKQRQQLHMFRRCILLSINHIDHEL